MRLVLASKNDGKIKEIRKELEPLGIEILTYKDLNCWEDLEETGETLEENAILKAKALCDRYGIPALADDSGLFVDALGGLPGVESARFAGPEQDAEKNIDLLLERLKDIPKEERKAKFVCVLALVFPEGLVRISRGECVGLVMEERKGTLGFGYDPIFQPDGYACSFGEMALDEKNRVSHRGRALNGMKEILRSLLAADR